MLAAEYNKVTDRDQVTGKYRSSAYWNCNSNLKLTKKVSGIFHNLEGYGIHLIIHVKISVILNRLESCMAFTINKNMVFTECMHLMYSSLDALVKKLKL